MATALLISSLALLVGMLSQLALLPRRRRATAPRIEAASSAGGGARAPLAVIDQSPTAD